jgi:response regulator RpfG family c-di-GMP phosphodiesterase
MFLTAKGREVDIAKGLALGADAYITKPFSNVALVAKVKEILEKPLQSPVKTLEACKTILSMGMEFYKERGVICIKISWFHWMARSWLNVCFHMWRGLLKAAR